MREIKSPESKPKRHLLDAAERLFAEQGFDAVSVRDITKRAKANVAAVNYHFGSRDGLIALVITRCITPVHQQRLALLETLEKKWPAKTAPVEEILDAFLRPVIEVAGKADLSEALLRKLIGRILSLPGDDLPPAIDGQTKELNARFMRSLAKSLPSVSAEELLWRLHFVTGSIHHLLVHQEAPQRQGGSAAGNPTMEATLGRLIRFAAAGLCEGAEIESEEENSPQAMFEF